MTEYHAWTARAVRDRIIQARETERVLPRVNGPQAFGNAMPEIIRQRSTDYVWAPTRVMPRAAAGAIDDMVETQGWINDMLDEADRKLIRDFANIKTDRNGRIGQWCEKNGWVERIFRRRVTALCQRIAEELNRKHHLRLSPEDCDLSEMSAEPTSETLSSESHELHEMLADARPGNLPEHPDRKALVRHLQRRAMERSRQRGGAAA